MAAVDVGMEASQSPGESVRSPVSRMKVMKIAVMRQVARRGGLPLSEAELLECVGGLGILSHAKKRPRFVPSIIIWWGDW